jgi:hypothetical protein
MGKPADMWTVARLVLLLLLASGVRAEAATPWCVGRYYLQLPDTAILAGETQAYDGVTLRFRALDNESFSAFIARRRSEIVNGAQAPPVKEYEWSDELQGILFVAEPSAPAGLLLEGHRALRDNVLVATASGDRAKAGAMEQGVLAALKAFRPGEGPDGNHPGLCVAGGVLPVAIHNDEDVRATINLPQPGALLKVDEAWAGAGAKAMRVARDENVVPAGANHQTVVLRESARVIGGMAGTELVIAKTDPRGISLHAYFDAGGDADQAAQPQLQLHLATGPDVGHRSGLVSQKKFLRLWDTLLASVVAHP